MMRILWFTGAQFPAISGKSTTPKYWQEGMRSALAEYFPNLELGIASFANQPQDVTKVGNTAYYTILRTGTPTHSRLKRIIQNWCHYQYNWDEINQYDKIIANFKPDLIVSYGTENPFVLSLKKSPLPSLVIIQGSIEQIAKHYFDAIDHHEFMQLVFSKDFLTGVGPIHRYLYLKKYKNFERMFYEDCHNFSGRTKWDKDLILKYNSTAHYYHCDEIINPVFFNSKWDPNKTRENVVYSTCSDALFKGSLSIVKSFALLKQQGRTDIKLRLGGVNINSVVGQFIKNIINKHHLEDQIEILGTLNHGQIIEQINSAKIFVLPSHMENSPNSLCEAMVLGAPCIASNAGGTSSMLTHEYEGLIYEPKDLEHLAENIIYLIDNPDIAASYGAQARKTARKRHDPKTNVDNMVEIYNQVISTQSK